MSADRKPVIVHYRRFYPESDESPSLETLVRNAMQKAINPDVRVKDRYRERLQQNGADSYFINLYETSDAGSVDVFGDVLHFTQGHLQALCEIADPNAAAVPVAQMRAPEQNEYVHSEMFWMVRGNHVFVLQSMSLRTEHFEKYLEWLLRDKTQVLGAGSSVSLAAKFDEEEVGGDLNDIQEIVVGGIAAQPRILEKAQIAQPAESAGAFKEVVTETTQHGGVDTGRVTGWDTARKILRELLDGDANVDQLMQAVPADVELNVQVHIGYKTKKRNVDRVALKQLETGLRNLPDSQLQVVAKGGKISKDGEIRLHHKANIKLLKTQDGENEIVGTLLDPNDVRRAMREAYATLADNGKIES